MALTEDQISHNIGISRTTLYNWKTKNIDILNALKKRKRSCRHRSRERFIQKSGGYDYEETTIEKGIETKRITKHMPGDTTAMIYWLKNRKPQQWRERRELENVEVMEKLDQLLEAQQNAQLDSKTKRIQNTQQRDGDSKVGAVKKWENISRCGTP